MYTIWLSLFLCCPPFLTVLWIFVTLAIPSQQGCGIDDMFVCMFVCFLFRHFVQDSSHISHTVFIKTLYTDGGSYRFSRLYLKAQGHWNVQCNFQDFWWTWFEPPFKSYFACLVGIVPCMAPLGLLVSKVTCDRLWLLGRKF